MRIQWVVLCAGLAALSACVSAPTAPPVVAQPRPPVVTAPPVTSAPAVIIAGTLGLGAWSAGRPGQVSQQFATSVQRRYPAGQVVAAAVEDLGQNGFTCGAVAAGALTDLPTQSCRRSFRDAGCSHIWLVRLFQERGSQRLSRSEGTYERACGGDGLLGGPGR